MAQVVVGRMDNRTTVEVADGLSVEQVLRQQGFTPTTNEVVVNAEGDEVSLNATAENGGWYLLSQHTKSGC